MKRGHVADVYGLLNLGEDELTYVSGKGEVKGDMMEDPLIHLSQTENVTIDIAQSALKESSGDVEAAQKILKAAYAAAEIEMEAASDGREG